MNFSFSEDQIAIQQSMQRVFNDLCSDDAIKALAKTGNGFHQALWDQLAESGILSLPFPEQNGGIGMGLLELCLIIELQGKSVAPIPLISSMVESAMSIADSDNTALKDRVLPQLMSGELILSSTRAYTGLQEGPALSATVQNGRYEISGRSGFTAYAEHAGAYLVELEDQDGQRCILYCEKSEQGLSVVPQTAINDEPAGYLIFDRVSLKQDRLIAIGEQAEKMVALQQQRVWIALAAMQTGVLEEGLKRTAAYVSERKQFGRLLGGFQAVSQQAANAYMEIEALRSVYWRALEDVQNGNDFSISAAVTKYWVAEAGHQAAHTVLHLHGGIGQDLDYPIHRFFLYAKQCERYLGSTHAMSVLVGQALMSANQQSLEELCL